GPELSLICQAFAPVYAQLPLSLKELDAEIERALKAQQAVAADRLRVRLVVGSLSERMGLGWWGAWGELSQMATSGDVRAREEHDAKEIGALLKFQTVIDHYYLAIATAGSK